MSRWLDATRAAGLVMLCALATVAATATLAAAQTDPSTTVPTTSPPATAAPAESPTSVPASPPARSADPAPAATSAGSDGVVPVLECSFRDPGTGELNTVWGYTTPRDRTIPIGKKNSFDNPARDAGQPKKFVAGTQQNVFVVTHTGPSTWTVDGAAVTAPDPKRTCSANPVPVAASGWAGLVTLAAVTLLLGTLLWWRVRRRPRRA